MVTRAVRIALTPLACVAFVACSGDEPSPGRTLETIKQHGEITWGADRAGGEPYVYEDPNNRNHIIGFEVDIMEAVARRLGVKARMVQYNWSNLVPSLERGDFDIVMNGLEATADRRERILLSEPYFTYAETLTVPSDSKILSIFELAGKRVGTLNQTFADDILRMLPAIDRKIYEGNEEPYRDLENGRADAVLLDNIIAERYGCTPEHPKLKCVHYDVARGNYVIGMRKGDQALKRAIDEALAAMRADGELERILRKAQLWDERQAQDASLTASSLPVPTFDWEMTKQFLWAATVTLEISVLAFLLAVPIGLLLAIARVYGGKVAATAARIYIELFRGTPVLLQLYVLYYGLGPFYSLGPMQAAIIGLGLNYGAYEAEVYRGAILAIPRGQTEAAKALGMRPGQILRHVLLPQALRLALPPMTNDFVSMLKDSSLVSVITVIELTKRMTIAGVDMRGWLVPGIACALLYLALSFPLSEMARRLERRLSRDQRPQAL
ncbi:MAG: Amino acid transporter binding protein and permease protein [Myxococcales bacterium]|nr:Amino acid transporter binding protein and permease protein [Myxococcales bacterium]